jgi:hypothetical protein
MDESKSLGQKAYEMFRAIPLGLMLPDTLLLRLSNKLNDRLGKTGADCIRLEYEREILTLPDDAANAAIELIPTLGQTKAPSTEDIARLL